MSDTCGCLIMSGGSRMLTFLLSCSVHVGDTASIVTSMALDADRVITGRVEIGQQVLTTGLLKILMCSWVLGHSALCVQSSFIESQSLCFSPTCLVHNPA